MATAVPAPRLFSRGEFQHMVETGLLAGERVELLEGTILTMSPQNTPHAAVVNRLNYQLMRSCGPDMYIRVQSPIALDAYNQPEPDLVVCTPDPLDYAQTHPQPEQIFFGHRGCGCQLETRSTSKGAGLCAKWHSRVLDRRSCPSAG